MSALIYIIRKSIKNTLKELLHKPGKLILYLFVIAALVGMFLLSFFMKQTSSEAAPLFWLTGIIAAFIGAFFAYMLSQGLSKGSAIFEMCDVNLLFVTPVAPRKILAYGITRMVKTAFVSAFFILFQVGTLANFGIGYGGIVLIALGYMMSMVVLAIVSLLVYSVTNGNPARKRFVKMIGIGLFAIPVLFFALQYFSTNDLFGSLKTLIESPFLRFFPVAGWTASALTAFFTGDILIGFGFLGLNLLLGGGMIIYIMLSNPDYYEDVLVSTETAFERKRALVEGNLGSVNKSPRKVKVNKTGISGNGAAALFGKHMRENLRESRLGILTLSSLIIVGGALVAIFFIRDTTVVLQILLWCQIMLVGTGRGLKETYSHYIFMIPESSFRKIIWCNMEIMARTLVECVLIFGIGGFCLRENPLYILINILVYVLFTFLLLGINFLSMRYIGADVSGGILIMIYYLAVIIVMAPGLVAAVVSGFMIGGNFGYYVGLLVLSGWELVAGLICFALSSGVLHNCDMSVMKTRG